MSRSILTDDRSRLVFGFWGRKPNFEEAKGLSALGRTPALGVQE